MISEVTLVTRVSKLVSRDLVSIIEWMAHKAAAPKHSGKTGPLVNRKKSKEDREI
jgi:hypothetical protein